MAVFEDDGKQRLHRRLDVDPKVAFRRRSESAREIERSEVARLRSLAPEESMREFFRIMRLGQAFRPDA